MTHDNFVTDLSRVYSLHRKMTPIFLNLNSIK